MKRILLGIALFTSGCVEPIAVAGTSVCPDLSVRLDTSCVHLPTLGGWFISIVFTVWLVSTLNATRAAVDRIEKKLNEKPPAPPSGDARS